VARRARSSLLARPVIAIRAEPDADIDAEARWNLRVKSEEIVQLLHNREEAAVQIIRRKRRHAGEIEHIAVLGVLADEPARALRIEAEGSRDAEPIAGYPGMP
jgi:hypothetical protein